MEKESQLGDFLGCALPIIFLVYGAIQIYAGYVGIDYYLGAGWAIAAVVAAFVIRLMLPLTIGSFYCALDVWGWHWAWAILFAAPGLAYLALMIPGMLGQIFRRNKN